MTCGGDLKTDCKLTLLQVKNDDQPTILLWQQYLVIDVSVCNVCGVIKRIFP